MIRELKTLHAGEPACQKRSDSDHLRFVIHRKDEKSRFDFTIELNGTKSWAVPDVPSMNPLEQCFAMEDEIETERILEVGLDECLTTRTAIAWDKGNYIPIDDSGNILSEFQALECLLEGSLKFFLQGKKLVGEFVLMKKGNDWLLMKRHDEFALYNTYTYESVDG